MLGLVSTLPLLLALSFRHTDPPVALSETEQLRREIVYLQDQLHRALTATEQCAQDLAPFRQQRDRAIVAQAKAQLKADIERAHRCAQDGCTFNTDTWTLEWPRRAAPTP